MTKIDSLSKWQQFLLRMCQGVWAIFSHKWLITLLFRNRKANCLCWLRPFHTAKNCCPTICIRATVTPNRSLFGKPPGTSLILFGPPLALFFFIIIFFCLCVCVRIILLANLQPIWLYSLWNSAHFDRWTIFVCPVEP